jgi:hypothetical protein
MKGHGNIAGIIGLAGMIGFAIGSWDHHPEILRDRRVLCLIAWVAAWFWVLGFERGSAKEVKLWVAEQEEQRRKDGR